MFVRSFVCAFVPPQALSGLKSALLGLKSAFSGLKSALSGLESALSGLKFTLSVLKPVLSGLESAFWAAALKGPMTYAIILKEIFLLPLLLPLRLKSQS